jgi:CBS-domain-containing membrane protein
MKAKDVMSRAVITVRPHVSVDVAAAVLVAHGFASAPVVTAEGVLRGMVSEGDLLRTRPVPDAPTTGADPTTVADVMTPQPTTVRAADELVDVAGVLLDRGVHAVPVLQGERLVGILSRHDVLRLIARRRKAPTDRQAAATAS